jgi:pilus assembly protein Flp/PilA
MNLQSITNWLQARFSSDERGAALVEYGLLVALIAVACILVLGFLGDDIVANFQDIVDAI